MNTEGTSGDRRGREEHQTETQWETGKGPDRPAQDDSGGNSSALSEISSEPDESWGVRTTGFQSGQEYKGEEEKKRPLQYKPQRNKA
ncbi:hypothetical protein NDU88_002039 [Pleurodeles waltl]|uniref:Uncharacterized protein n=1 Tax=Pleurodeles waltl TaxID=8319 RepID=A0AAV7Q5F3_PLEWA|nr:hypothetical protein NDU88_002039 [Pleurodeles waltl]